MPLEKLMMQHELTDLTQSTADSTGMPGPAHRSGEVATSASGAPWVLIPMHH